MQGRQEAVVAVENIIAAMVQEYALVCVEVARVFVLMQEPVSIIPGKAVEGR